MVLGQNVHRIPLLRQNPPHNIRGVPVRWVGGFQQRHECTSGRIHSVVWWRCSVVAVLGMCVWDEQHIYIHTNIFVYMYCICVVPLIYMYIYIHTQIYVYKYIYLCIKISMQIFINIYIFIFIYIIIFSKKYIQMVNNWSIILKWTPNVNQNLAPLPNDSEFICRYLLIEISGAGC